MITKAFFVLVQPQTADRDLCKCIRLWPLPYHSCRPVRARFGIGQVDISGLISDIITLLWCLTCTVPRMYITGRPRCKDELFGTVLVRQPRRQVLVHSSLKRLVDVSAAAESKARDLLICQVLSQQGHIHTQRTHAHAHAHTQTHTHTHTSCIGY